MWILLQKIGSPLIKEKLFPRHYFSYILRGYLSIDKSQGYLKDDKRILYSYFSMLLSGLLESFEELDNLFSQLAEFYSKRYDLIKSLKGEKIDKTVDRKIRYIFKYYIVTIGGILDTSADLIALFFTGQIKNLVLGKSEFNKIDYWLKKPFEMDQLIESPHKYYLSKLHNSLSKVVISEDPEKDWLSIFRLYRNKSTHLGLHMFKHIGLQGNDGAFHIFLPRKWPYIFEKHISITDTPSRKPKESLKSFFEDVLMHQDLMEFSHGLKLKIMTITEELCDILCEFYEQLITFSLNEEALNQISKNEISKDFKYFNEF